MKKLIIAAVAASTICAAFASEDAESAEKNWRLTVGGFGRGNIKTSIRGMGSDHVEVYGADLDLQYSVWQNDMFNIWLGVGGTFCPRQDVSDGFGSSRTQSTRDVSTDGSTVIDFNYGEESRGSLDMGYGELRFLLVPEWKATDSLSLGVRLGVAFDWINAKYSGHQNWAWNQQTAIDIPPYVHDVSSLSDSGSNGTSGSETKFAAQGIIGLQATYLFFENFGLYANVDWRLGDETDFNFGDGRRASVDMSGWYWGVGAVVSF